MRPLSAYTGRKEDTIYAWIRRHNIPHKKDKYGRVIVDIMVMAAFKPASNPHWNILAEIQEGSKRDQQAARYTAIFNALEEREGIS